MTMRGRFTPLSGFLLGFVLFSVGAAEPGSLALAGENEGFTGTPGTTSRDGSLTYRATTSKSPGDVLQDLEFAIGARNYRITSRNSIGVAIEHRENIPFSDAEVIHFCNVEAAQRLLELSPDYLVHMPCRIAVWRGKRGTFVETLLVPLDIHPASAGMVEEINRMLREIVDSAVEPWN